MEKHDQKLLFLRNIYIRLYEACSIYEGKNDLIRDCVIYRFKVTYELCHKTLHEFMKHMGTEPEGSFPRTIFKKAYANGIIADDRLWIRLMEDRNGTSHIYSEKLADAIAARIKNEYLPAVGDMIRKIDELK